MRTELSLMTIKGGRGKNSPETPKLRTFMTNMPIRYLLQVVIVLHIVYRMINNIQTFSQVHSIEWHEEDIFKYL